MRYTGIYSAAKPERESAKHRYKLIECMQV